MHEYFFLNPWIFESFAIPIAIGTPKHRKPQDIFWILYPSWRNWIFEFLNSWIFWIFESLNLWILLATNARMFFFLNPIPASEKLNPWIFESLNPWIFEFFKPRMHECFVATKTQKHKKPQNIFWILLPLKRPGIFWIFEFFESLNLWILESLNFWIFEFFSRASGPESAENNYL